MSKNIKKSKVNYEFNFNKKFNKILNFIFKYINYFHINFTIKI